jgi:hypothetical protein
LIFLLARGRAHSVRKPQVNVKAVYPQILFLWRASCLLQSKDNQLTLNVRVRELESKGSAQVQPGHCEDRAGPQIARRPFDRKHIQSQVLSQSRIYQATCLIQQLY